jgi:hypothetical protein
MDSATPFVIAHFFLQHARAVSDAHCAQNDVLFLLSYYVCITHSSLQPDAFWFKAVASVSRLRCFIVQGDICVECSRYGAGEI